MVLNFWRRVYSMKINPFNKLLCTYGYDQKYHMSRVVRKPVFGVFDQVGCKSGCTTTEDGLRLENSDLEKRGIVLSL